jgi:carbon-monoxide dehydrogenase medium subunit
MSAWQQYILARSLHEAFEALTSSKGPALPIGGGTDLLLEIQQGVHPPVHTLVDITQIPELNRLEVRNGRLFIGAGITIRIIVESPLVRQHAIAVCEACYLIGGPQVRNTATLGGNVAHALPAADGMIALLAMDAQAEIASLAGCRLAPLQTLFLGPGKSALQKDREILVGFYLPLRQAGQGSAFARIMRPQGVALPILNTAVWLQRNGGWIEDIRIAIGPSGPTPVRAEAAESVMRGKTLDAVCLHEAAQAIHQTIHFRTSAMRASAEYRHHLSEVLLNQVITTAWQRAASAEN